MTTNPPADLDTLAREWREALAAAGDEGAVEEWRRSVLGRSGGLTGVLRGLSSLPPEERRATGQAANVLKRDLEAALEARQEELRASALASQLTEGAVDVTLPGGAAGAAGCTP